MPQFSLRQLFVSLTVISIGFGVIALIKILPLHSVEDLLVDLLVLTVGVSIACAGIGYLFKNILWGAVIGIALTLAFVFMIAMISEFLSR